MAINFVSAGLAQYHTPRRVDEGPRAARSNKDRRQQGETYSRPDLPEPERFKTELQVASLRLGSTIDFRA